MFGIACCARDFDDEIKAFILAKPDNFTYKQLSFLCEASLLFSVRSATSQGFSHSRDVLPWGVALKRLISCCVQASASGNLSLQQTDTETAQMEMEAALLESAAVPLQHVV